MKMLSQLNPKKIIFYWLLASVIFSIVGFIDLGVSTSGGEQSPLTFLATMIPTMAYGVLILSIVTIPFFWQWIKQRWYFNLISFLLSFGLVVVNYFQGKYNYDPYDGEAVTIKVNGRVYSKVIEYYGTKKDKKIRSIGFLLGDKKDSSWTTFDQNRSIISQEFYRNDSLIRH